jgi:hypothetical protein
MTIVELIAVSVVGIVLVSIILYIRYRKHNDHTENLNNTNLNIIEAIEFFDEFEGDPPEFCVNMCSKIIDSNKGLRERIHILETQISWCKDMDSHRVEDGQPKRRASDKILDTIIE